MFKESGQKSVLIHRKSLSKEKNQNIFIPSLLSQETWTRKKKKKRKKIPNRNP